LSGQFSYNNHIYISLILNIFIKIYWWRMI